MSGAGMSEADGRGAGVGGDGVRGAGAGESGARAVGAYKLASVLLQYPTAALMDGVGELRAVAAGVKPKAAREAFGAFLDWLAAVPPDEVARHYVETFDLRRRCALYLTYYRYGDTRKRGIAMSLFKAAYRDAGYVPSDAELPDYLPMVLDFADLCPRGARLLRAHRADLELLRRAVQRNGTPYRHVIDAVAAQLPGLGRRELAKVRDAWESGPPREEVGMEPFAPPHYLAGYGALAGYGEGEPTAGDGGITRPGGPAGMPGGAAVSPDTAGPAGAAGRAGRGGRAGGGRR